MIRLLLSLTMAYALARADFDPARWQFRRSIAIAKPASVASFAVDRSLYQGSRAELDDVRIVRDQVETPCIIRKVEALDEFPMSPALMQDASPPSTVLTVDLGFQGLPHDRAQLMIEPGQFYRAVTAESSRDSIKWKMIGAGAIFRTADKGAFAITFSEQWDRYFRIRILNRDNPPLGVRVLMLSDERRVIEFPAEATGKYWLYYGSAGAHRPSYDFAETRPRQVNALVAELGAEEKNPVYHEMEKPWTDRHPVVLYGVLAAAILVMGFVAVRFLIKMQS